MRQRAKREKEGPGAAGNEDGRDGSSAVRQGKGVVGAEQEDDGEEVAQGLGRLAPDAQVGAGEQERGSRWRWWRSMPALAQEAEAPEEESSGEDEGKEDGAGGGASGRRGRRCR